MPPRPVPGSYWVVPRRLLVGEHPGSRSRAQSMERLRRFLEAGITCFIDLTEPDETPAYESLLPFETPSGRRVEYLREPIVDHDVPANRETMARILAMIDGALDAGHSVYLHCRAGIGRSATAAGCWLAVRNPGGGRAALEELSGLWRQASQSRVYPDIPETAEQAEFVRAWHPVKSRPVRQRGSATPATASAAAPATADDQLALRVRGAWLGLALGDALGGLAAAGGPKQESLPLAWTQHTALALCLAESLAEVGRCDARDQIERYWRWFKDGHCSSTGEPGEPHATADVARALATYRWRGLPMAGSHDPKDVAATSLPRVLAAVLHAGNDPAAAIALAAECSRTTHQSPTVLDSCRLLAAMLCCALQGRPSPTWLQGVPEPAASCWGPKPLSRGVRHVATTGTDVRVARAGGSSDVLYVLARVRRVLARAKGFEDAIAEAGRSARDDAHEVTALVGMVYGLQHGSDALPAPLLARLAQRATLEAVAARCTRHLAGGKQVTA